MHHQVKEENAATVEDSQDETEDSAVPNGECNSSASSFKIDFDPSVFEAQMLSAISDQS